MIRTMRAKYPGTCVRSGARINPGDYIEFDTITRKAMLQPDSDSITFYGETGPNTFYRNKQGRCLDAPCCGCCNI